MIKVENLSVSYSDKYVLNSITLEIPMVVGLVLLGRTELEKLLF